MFGESETAWESKRGQAGRDPALRFARQLKQQGFLPTRHFVERFLQRVLARGMRFDPRAFRREFFAARHYRQTRPGYRTRIAVVRGVPVLYRRGGWAGERIVLVGVLPVGARPPTEPVSAPSLEMTFETDQRPYLSWPPSTWPPLTYEQEKKPGTIQRQYRRYKARGRPLSFLEWKGKYGPGVTRRHHLVPQEFVSVFKTTGKFKYPAVVRQLCTLNIDIHRLIVDIPESMHKKIHPQWNQELKAWFKKNPRFTKAQLRQQINSMLNKYEIPRRYRTPLERYGRGTRQPPFYKRHRMGKKKYQRRAAAK